MTTQDKIKQIRQHHIDTLQKLPVDVVYAPNYILTDVPLDEFKAIAGKNFLYNHHGENLQHRIELSSVAAIGLFSVPVGEPDYSAVNYGY